MGELWTQDITAAEKYGVIRIEGFSGNGLGRGRTIHFGENSGFQAINLAYLFGATRIILLGFDMQRTDGKEHWHGNHPSGLNRHSPFEKFAKNFDALSKDLEAEGVEVINATRQTALKCFKRKNLEEALC